MTGNDDTRKLLNMFKPNGSYEIKNRREKQNENI